MFCNSCLASDPACDTVRVNLSPTVREDVLAAQAEEADHGQEEGADWRADEQPASDVQIDFEQEGNEGVLELLNNEGTQRRQTEEECDIGNHEILIWEPLGRAKQESADVVQRQLDTERAGQEMEPADRKAVEEWLQKNKFSGINAKRSSIFRSRFPLHVAAKERNVEMATLLVRLGADPAAKNSLGQTPAALAAKLNKKGSHDAVLKVVRASPPSVGGA